MTARTRSKSRVYMFSVIMLVLLIQLSAIQNLIDRYPDVHQKLQSLQHQLSDISVLVNLVNIPGHSGITGNEMADRKAKEVHA